MKWEEMTSRERDALVAEKVMGWERREGSKETFVQYGDYFVLPDGSGRYINDGCWPFTPLPHFSTDIAAAWLVVDKLGMCVRPDMALFVRDGDYSCGWRAIAGRLILDGGYTVDGDGVFVAVAATAPEAICYAALKAAGVL